MSVATKDDIGDLEAAVLAMLRFPYARTEAQRETRPSCSAVLALLSMSSREGGRLAKRIQLEG